LFRIWCFAFDHSPGKVSPLNSSATPERRLSLVDCTSITVGIIIGSGIYESMGLVAAQAANVGELAGLWIAGGVFALLGSLCYAELATRYPEEGGDYVYLTNAYGRPIGFLFAWTQLWIIRPGSIGALACVFADFATQLASLGRYSFLVYACGSIVVLSLLNMVGVRQSTRVQNLLTAAKVLGLTILVVAGLFGPAAEAAPVAATGGSLSLAMIFVLFAYSGWNEMGCVAAEVRDPRRNILRSLLAGAAIVTLVYLGLNAACWKLLGLAGMASAEITPAAAADIALGSWGAKALSVIICISALNSTNGMIFTGSRIYYAMGKRHRLFAPLAVWNERFGTPLMSLGVQTVVTLVLVVGFGGLAAAVDAREAFKRLVIFTTPPFYVFMVLSAVAVIVFRRRESQPNEATYRMPLFPLAPFVVGAASAYMAYSCVAYVAQQWSEQGANLITPTAWVTGTLVTGVLFALLDRRETDAAVRTGR
jgi:amino acid transporter